MATTTVTPDLETISMDELRKLAEEEARKATTTTTTTEEAVTTTTEEEEEEETKGPFFAERSIDLGDGAGVQVFKGKGDTREAALEDLSDKLADAQKHATKKIRDLSAKVKVEEPKVSAEDESLYSAELLKTPTEAFKKLFKQVTGVDIQDFKTTLQREKEFQAGLTKKNAADAFVAANPDYQDTARNGKLLNKWCELHNDFSTEGLTKAYQDLNESGLLDVKGEEASAEQKEAEAEIQRIAEQARSTSSQRTRKASGLSTQRRAVATTPATPTEDDMYNMPLDELRKRANQQLAGRS